MIWTLQNCSTLFIGNQITKETVRKPYKSIYLMLLPLQLGVKKKIKNHIQNITKGKTWLKSCVMNSNDLSRLWVSLLSHGNCCLNFCGVVWSWPSSSFLLCPSGVCCTDQGAERLQGAAAGEGGGDLWAESREEQHEGEEELLDFLSPLMSCSVHFKVLFKL